MIILARKSTNQRIRSLASKLSHVSDFDDEKRFFMTHR